MKSTILIAILATLVACKSEVKSSKSCTYNGVPVVCESDPASYTENTENSEVVVTATVTTAINVDEKHIEFLENTYDYQEKSKDAYVYPCSSSTNAGTQISYKMAQDKLIILSDVMTNQGIKTELETYTRLPSQGEDLVGTWMVQKNIKKDLYVTKFLTFGEKSMKAVLECHYR